MIKLFINPPTPIPEFQHAPLPPKCCELGNVPQLLLFSLFTFKLVDESIKEFEGALIVLKK
jgi:hypothetical protein